MTQLTAGQTLRLNHASLSDVGRGRSNNEDAVAADDAGIFLVADGIGGSPAGEIASALAVKTAQEMFRRRRTPATTFAEANRQIYQAGIQNPAWRGMGTTLDALIFWGSSAVVAHVGDSRVYLARGRVLHPLTQDHSVRHMLLRSVGTPHGNARPDVHLGEAQRGDVYLLCTDGLHGCVSDREIELILRGRSPTTTCARLIEAAYSHGAPDNVSCVVVRVEG